MKLLDALNWRYGVKRFSDEKISSTELTTLLDATRLSASSYGLQPYNILVIETETIREKLLPFSYGQDKVLNSSHLIIFAAHTQVGDITVDRYIDNYVNITGKTHSELDGLSTHMKSALANKTSEQKQEWAHQQAYIALGNFLTCAAMMKIDSCPMTGFESEGYDAVLSLEEKGLSASVICPIGRRHNDDSQANIPKVRFSYDQIVLSI